MPNKEKKYSKSTINQLKNEFVVSTANNNREQLLHIGTISGNITKVSESHLKHRAYSIQRSMKDIGQLSTVGNNGLIHCLKHIQKVIYDPTTTDQLIPNDDGFYNLNSFKTPAMFESMGEIDGVVPIPSLFEEFMTRLFPKPKERDFMLKWMSKSIFDPKFKIRVAPILRGSQGTGKNVFITLLSKLCGDSNVIITTLNIVASGFNSNASECTVCCLDETYSNTKSVADKIKTLITETKMPITRKHEDTKNEKVWSNVIILSNDEHPLHIEEDDRRYFIPEFLQHKVDNAETATFIGTMFDWIDNELGIYELYEYLRYYHSITKNDNDGFYGNIKTDQHKNMVNNAKFNASMEILGFIGSSKKVALDDIKKALPHIRQSTITASLRDNDFEQTTIREKGVRNRYWVKFDIVNKAVRSFSDLKLAS